MRNTLDQYSALHSAWRWDVPKHFNIARECLHRWASDPKIAPTQAIIWEDEHGTNKAISYLALAEQVDRFANALKSLGVKRSDRIGICLPQRIETAIALLGTVQMGAVAVPLTTLFGPEALAYRLKHSDCKILIVDERSIATASTVWDETPDLLTHLITSNSSHPRGLSFDVLLRAANVEAEIADTLAEDAAIIIYTSGTTGPPKGALLPHRAMLGNLPGFIYSHNQFPQEGDVFWSPADWAWTGGLWDALLPTLYFGKTIVGYAGRFDPERAFSLMERHQVTCTFLFPTALKMMMKTIPAPMERFKLKLRSIMSAGESVGETVFRWTEEALGITLNEMFGQTELNYIVGNCAPLWLAKAGSMGRGYPGHRVAVVDENGQVLPANETGDVALNIRDIHGELDPIVFSGYLGNEAGTLGKYAGKDNAWCRTGDMARMDAEGYLWYEGRSDDVIKSAGYRIGPAEVESCLISHPSVALAAVIGKPDPERGEIVKAFIVLADGISPSPALESELAAHVRGRLAPYEYPKEFAFVSELPMTTTGKIQRKVLRDAELLAQKQI